MDPAIGQPSGQMVREIETRIGPCPGSRLQWESQSVVQHVVGNPNAVNASVVQSLEAPAQLRVTTPVPKVQGSMVGPGIYGGGEGLVDGLPGMDGQLVGLRGNERVMLQHTVGDFTRPQEFHPFPIARPPPTPVVPQIPDIPCIPISKAVGGGYNEGRAHDLHGARSVGSGEFQTPRGSSTGQWGLSVDGYPSGGTVIRPPPLPPSSVPPGTS